MSSGANTSTGRPRTSRSPTVRPLIRKSSLCGWSGNRSTMMSMSLASPASPRATDPKTRGFTAPNSVRTRSTAGRRCEIRSRAETLAGLAMVMSPGYAATSFNGGRCHLHRRPQRPNTQDQLPVHCVCLRRSLRMGLIPTRPSASSPEEPPCPPNPCTSR